MEQVHDRVSINGHVLAIVYTLRRLDIGLIGHRGQQPKNVARTYGSLNTEPVLRARELHLAFAQNKNSSWLLSLLEQNCPSRTDDRSPQLF